MIYLSGHVSEGCVMQPDLGVMLTPQMGNKLPPHTIWAADTGCYANPAAYDTDKYLDWLGERDPKLCLFATAPDVVGDGEATVRKARPVLPLIRAAGYRAALVAQDGVEFIDVDVPWDEFDALFIGGTTPWKLSEAAYRLAREADGRGKWTHMGRVNSWRRLKAAAVSGYDSADGTYLKHGPDVLLPKLQRWIETLRREPVLS